LLAEVPLQIASAPLIAAGAAFTVSAAVLLHPSGSVYTMLLTPASKLVTTPAASTVAIAVLLLVQLPPAGVEESVAVVPTHPASVPVIVEGVSLMVTILVTVHPVMV
jgi:hypothetical protein